MAADHRQGLRLVVLAANRHSDPIARQMLQGLLEGDEGVAGIIAAKLDAGFAILPQNATP